MVEGRYFGVIASLFESSVNQGTAEYQSNAYHNAFNNDNDFFEIRALRIWLAARRNNFTDGIGISYWCCDWYLNRDRCVH